MTKKLAGKRWFAAKGQRDQAVGNPLSYDRFSWPYWAQTAYRHTYLDQALAVMVSARTSVMTINCPGGEVSGSRLTVDLMTTLTGHNPDAAKNIAKAVGVQPCELRKFISENVVCIDNPCFTTKHHNKQLDNSTNP